MSLLLQNPLSYSTHRLKLFFPPTITNPHLTPPNTLKFPLFSPPTKTLTYPLHKSFYLHTKAYETISPTTLFQEEKNSEKRFNFDAFLTFIESFCLVSSLLVSLGCVVNWIFFRQLNLGLVELGRKVLVWLLGGAVVVGSVIRRRQWKRVCRVSGSTSSRVGREDGSGNGNVVERIERLEESMKSATSLIRMLSRHLEKLGIRFRVHRKSLKQPIAETAALAQKNSEATRAIAMQEDILEKELLEVQNVLLAMQDQQQKQLELILAIADNARLLEPKQAPSRRPSSPVNGPAEKKMKQVDGHQEQAKAGSDKALG